MRVAIFTEVYSPMVSGVSRTLARTADALAARGHAVRVYSATYARSSDEPERTELHASPSRPLPFAPDVQWAAPDYRVLKRDVTAFRPDVIHLATEFAMGYAGLRVARGLDVPIVATAHTDYERYAAGYGLGWAVRLGWVYLRWFYRHARRVLAPTEDFRRHLVARGVGRTAVWGRGVDLRRFAPRFRSGDYRARLGLADGDLLVACVGRLAPEKGIDRLLDVWRSVAALRPRAHLVFTGSGLMEPAIRAAALPRVHLTGPLHGEDLATAYASADAFVMPSCTETFGNVTLEAMASGLPIVGFDAGGTGELGRHDQTMLLAPADRPDRFAMHLDRLLGDPPLRSRLASAALDAATARSWEPLFDALEGHYRSARLTRESGLRRAA